MSGDLELGERALKALLATIDTATLGARLRDALPPSIGSGQAPNQPTATATSTSAGEAAASKLVLSDLLGDDILGARPQDAAFPLRLFLGVVGESLEEDQAFTLATGLNFYFRATMPEPAKMQLGLEISRLYYDFAYDKPLEKQLVAPLSALLAQLMSTQLELLAFECIDHQNVFDSASHERAAGSDQSGSRLKRPGSFLCRVLANQRVRAKALAVT